MRTAGQHDARRRREAARERARLDRNWHVVGWIDRRLNVLESQCPFTHGPDRDEWLRGYHEDERLGA